MHKRIKHLLDHSACVWNRPGFGQLELKCDSRGVAIQEHTSLPMDCDGIEALLDALHCYRDTGSFAALADTSPVPYAGKRMRYDGEEVIFFGRDGNGRGYVRYPGSSKADTSCMLADLRPLAPPKPRYRPYTAKEAGQHIGRHYLQDGSDTCLESVALFGVNPCDIKLHLSFDRFLEHCTWADTGEPCGVKIEELFY